MSEYQELVVVLLGTATAVLGWYYSRKRGIEQMHKRVEESNRSLIDSLQARLGESERQHQLQVEDLDRRLKLCEERWSRWQGSVG